MRKIPDCSTRQIRELVDEWILNERDREILYRNLADGIHYEPLAEEFKLSRSQIVRIINKGKPIIFRHLKPK